MLPLGHMFGLSFSHLIILFVIVLLFGSKRLPGLGLALGKGIASFKKGLEGAGVDESSEQVGNPAGSKEKLAHRDSNKDPHDQS